MDEQNIIEDTRGKSNIEETEKLVEERKKKLVYFLKNKQLWVIGVLIIAVILGVYIRSMPMQDHNPNVAGNQPGLWDITTNDWTLGPDLDPWLFTRQAKTIVENGSLPEIDYMRNVPLGFNNAAETKLLPYMIVWTYYLVNLLGDYSINLAAAIFPVMMFALTIIAFFLFVREIFIRKDKKTILRANLISIIATFFMIIVPVFLSRTLAGIPEKESAGFFFMFLTFYLFLKAWKSERIRYSIFLSIFAAISTAAMGLIWGGVIYVFVAIGVATLLAFILNKISKKEAIMYGFWLGTSILLLIFFSNRYNLSGFLTTTSNLISIFVLFVIVIHSVLWKTKISKYLDSYSKKIPKNIISIIVSVLLGAFLVSIIFGINFIPNKISGLIETFIKPVTGRWNVTVAENRQPYFTEWRASFGPFLKNVPILFWLFFIGSIILFKEMLKPLLKKDAWILTCLYILFFLGLVFSRYAPHPSILDGEGFISRLFYFSSAFLLTGALIYYYITYHKQGLKKFEEIDYEYLFFFSIFILTLFTARSAVRLIMVLGPISVILIGYLIITIITKFKQTKDETGKIIIGALIVLILLLSFFIFFGNPVTKTPGFYQQIKSEAYSMVPSYYNQQWQKAMNWVRTETPTNSVFAHWWDYGYWVQSIGDRATVLDGGNAMVYWNYLMGRLVLTGDNQKEALEFLYNHNATYLLIDSSDIGKYGAFASIGSDENYDRYSWIGTFLLDEKQTQETNNQTLLVYTGGVALDEDLTINESGKEVFLPGQQAGVGAIIIPIKNNNNTQEFLQPYAIMVYQNKQYKVNLRYLANSNQFIDYDSGIEATAFVFPKLTNSGQGISSNPIGSMMFLSPRLMRGFLTQKYILDDPFKKFQNFKLVHTEQNLIIEDLNTRGNMNLPDFIYYQGIQGPIKIWEIEYTGDEKIKEEYRDTDYSKYISWKL
ncbi:MAG: STT3 domain-containing protein [Nanoarchaeota archaeon]|nr:STT3 domain-containing protein [Nanoarchaeota archaeon]